MITSRQWMSRQQDQGRFGCSNACCRTWFWFLQRPGGQRSSVLPKLLPNGLILIRRQPPDKHRRMPVNMLNVINKNWGEEVIEFILMSEDTLNAELSWMVGTMSSCLTGHALSSTCLLNILVGRTTLKDAPYDDMATKHLTSTEEL